VSLGALVCRRQVERSPTLASVNPLLTNTMLLIGHPAIRNRGTIGGSIAHADPAGEPPTVLLAFDGSVEATCRRGTRVVAAADLVLGFLTTALEPDELLATVLYPSLEPGTGWSLHEFSRCNGDFGIVDVAAVLSPDKAGTNADVRIALSGMGGSPVRAAKAEATLSGQFPSNEVWTAAAEEVVVGLEPSSEVHGTSAYPLHLARVLTQRAPREAYERTEVIA
jgi:aerobic carbon-monoxide dehydrogenase medium subunit